MGKWRQCSSTRNKLDTQILFQLITTIAAKSVSTWSHTMWTSSWRVQGFLFNYYYYWSLPRHRQPTRRLQQQHQVFLRIREPHGDGPQWRALGVLSHGFSRPTENVEKCSFTAAPVRTWSWAAAAGIDRPWSETEELSSSCTRGQAAEWSSWWHELRELLAHNTWGSVGINDWFLALICDPVPNSSVFRHSVILAQRPPPCVTSLQSSEVDLQLFLSSHLWT